MTQEERFVIQRLADNLRVCYGTPHLHIYPIVPSSNGSTRD